MTEWKRNAFRCKKCGMVVESKSVHDFQSCKCGNFTDGGLEYVRRGGKIEDMEDLSEPRMQFGKKKSPAEIFNKVKVTYHKATGLLCIDDYDTNEQLAVFYVTEED